MNIVYHVKRFTKKIKQNNVIFKLKFHKLIKIPNFIHKKKILMFVGNGFFSNLYMALFYFIYFNYIFDHDILRNCKHFINFLMK